MTIAKCTPKILIVDDRPANILAMQKMLTGLDAQVLCAESGNEALALTLQHNFAICLLDVMMPDMNGFETAEFMRQNDTTADLPIIFVTAMDNSDEHLSAGYATGAVDYLYKPINKDILLAKVKVFLALECRQQELVEANDLIAEQNLILETRANTDGLTGLFNHAHFQEAFTREFELAKRHDHELTILMFDLDYFKDVNDTYGHQIGDVVLKDFAKLLSSETRDTDILARYGGEEFILALPNTNVSGGIKVAEKFRALVEQYVFRHGKTSLQVTVSIGVSNIGQVKHSRDLIEQADSALYKAKASGRNRVVNCQELKGCNEIEESDFSFSQILNQLQATLEKNKAAALASFEALVHSRLKDVTSLKERNDKALRMVNFLGKRLNLPKEMLETFRRSFKLHDLFRLYISDPVLEKNTPLSAADQQAILNQPLLMKELTDLFDFFANERQILLHHHEHFDGTGYPEGLEGDEVPLGSRLFAVVDAVIAMTTPSYPRDFSSTQELIDEIKEQAGKQFDPLLAEMVVSILQEEDLV